MIGEKGLVTTVIPVYNRQDQLAEAVESVAAQDYRPIEIVIVDDGSTDATPSVADALARKYDFIRVIRKANGGPGLAREAGRQAARGEFIQYLDSDDVLLPAKFSAQIRGLSERPECGVSYGVTRFRAADGQLAPGPWKHTGQRFDTMFPMFLRYRWWETATPLYRASVCHAAGPWTSLWAEEDWEYDCRVAALGTRLHYCDHPVSEHRDHAGPRLSRGTSAVPRRMADRARAHELIYGHAVRAGIAAEEPAMAHFARELFLISRQCGQAGLAQESEKLFNLAVQASTRERAAGADFALYGLIARAIGWTAAGRLACLLDRVRPA